MSSKIISVSISNALFKDLEKYCIKEERSRSYCVKKGLEQFLESQKKKKANTK